MLRKFAFVLSATLAVAVVVGWWLARNERAVRSSDNRVGLVSENGLVVIFWEAGDPNQPINETWSLEIGRDRWWFRCWIGHWPNEPSHKIKYVWLGCGRNKLWAYCVLFAAYPGAVIARGPFRRWLRRRNRCCPNCGYDLTGNVSGACSECGEGT